MGGSRAVLCDIICLVVTNLLFLGILFAPPLGIPHRWLNVLHSGTLMWVILVVYRSERYFHDWLIMTFLPAHLLHMFLYQDEVNFFMPILEFLMLGQTVIRRLTSETAPPADPVRKRVVKDE